VKEVKLAEYTLRGHNFSTCSVARYELRNRVLLGNAFLVTLAPLSVIYLNRCGYCSPARWVAFAQKLERISILPFFSLPCSILEILPFVFYFVTIRVSTFICCYRCEEEDGGGGGGKGGWKFLLKMILLFLLKMLPWICSFLAPQLHVAPSNKALDIIWDVTSLKHWVFWKDIATAVFIYRVSLGEVTAPLTIVLTTHNSFRIQNLEISQGHRWWHRARTSGDIFAFYLSLWFFFVSSPFLSPRSFSLFTLVFSSFWCYFSVLFPLCFALYFRFLVVTHATHIFILRLALMTSATGRRDLPKIGCRWFQSSLCAHSISGESAVVQLHYCVFLRFNIIRIRWLYPFVAIRAKHF
jgi:hypothetical protein